MALLQICQELQVCIVEYMRVHDSTVMFKTVNHLINHALLFITYKYITLIEHIYDKEKYLERYQGQVNV